MKTLVLLLLTALVPSGIALGEATDALILEEVRKSNVSLGEIDTKIGTISDAVTETLELARQDNNALGDIKTGVQDIKKGVDDLLTRIGNPAEVSMDDISKGRFGDVTDAVGNAKNDGILKDRPDVDPKDDSLFDSSFTQGIIQPLSKKYSLTYYPDNNGGKAKTEERDRDLSRYVGETHQVKAVQEYFRVRDKAVERREKLLEVLSDVLDDMKDNSDDFAHIAKQQALIEVIQGQLQVCSNDINNAFNDAAVTGLQVYALNSAQGKADAEAALEESKMMKEKAEKMAKDGTLTSTPPVKTDSSTPAPAGGRSTGGYLPWNDPFGS